MIYISIFVNIVLLLLFDYRCLSFSLCSGPSDPPKGLFLCAVFTAKTRMAGKESAVKFYGIPPSVIAESFRQILS